MLEILGLHNLENWIAQRKLSYYKMFDDDNAQRRRAIASNFDDSDSDIESSLRSIRATIEQYSQEGLRAYLWVVDNPKATNGGYYTWFRVPGTNPANPPINGIGNTSTGVPLGYIKEDELEKRLADQMEKFHSKMKMEQMEKELIELKKQNQELTQEETVWDRAMGYIEPFIPDLLNKFIPGTPAVSGTSKQPEKKEFPGETVIENQQKMSEEESDKVIQSLETLETVVPNLAEVLEKLANMAKENPNKLTGLLKFLK